MTAIDGQAIDALRTKLDGLDQPPAGYHRLVIVVDVRGVPATQHDPHDVAFSCLTDDDEVLRDLVVPESRPGDRPAVSSTFVAAEWLP